MEASCVFCKIAAGDAPAEIVDSDEHTVAFLDLNPATRGHSLVIPRRHSTDLMGIEEEDLERTTLAAKRLAERIDETLHPDGFNLLNACRPAAWQSVFHFHIHVIPRYSDDPLKLPWIPRGASREQMAETGAAIRGDGG
jgi:histidine triad (HIT) family protein